MALQDTAVQDENWWLRVMISSNVFFQPCPRCTQLKGRDSVVNHFDLDSGTSACLACLPEHRGNRLLQIRRSSYHDVLKVSDVSRAANVSSIQTYVINNDRVIFIRRRPLARIPKGPSLKVVRCSVCSRALQDNCLFCSLQCKLDATDAGCNPKAGFGSTGSASDGSSGDLSVIGIDFPTPGHPQSKGSPSKEHRPKKEHKARRPSGEATPRSSIPATQLRAPVQAEIFKSSSRRKSKPHRAPLM